MSTLKSVSYFVYMLECADGSYYTGMTSDLPKRITQHEVGDDLESYTFSRRPIKLVWFEEFATHNDAFNCEQQIKGWSRKKKQALIRNDWQEIHRIVHEEWLSDKGRKTS